MKSGSKPKLTTILSSTLIALFSTTIWATAPMDKYDLKDLEILEHSKGYKEFLDHAHDIRPSQRNKHWQEMVRNVALGFVSFKMEKNFFSTQDFEYIENILLWPSLRNDELFINKRNSYGVKYLEECFKNNSKQCNKQLNQFWKLTPERQKNAQLAVELGDLKTKYKFNANLWQLYSLATMDDLSNIYCQRSSIKNLLIDKIVEYIDSEPNEMDLRAKIHSLANSACWDSLNADLKNNLSSKSPIVRNYAYKILNARDQLSQNQKDIFLTLFILNSPSKGTIFNEAWNTINRLGNKYQQRRNVFKNIKKLDPLPGSIFAIPDHKKRKILIELLSTNFPEYIDHYAKTCINYLQGKGEFPNGNPTIECRELFKISKDTTWIDSNLKLKYETLPVF